MKNGLHLKCFAVSYSEFYKFSYPALFRNRFT